MDNTLESKAKFFALYWGQKVLCNTNKGWSDWTISQVSLREIVLAKSDSLELKPLLQISDEDSIEVVNIAKTMGIKCGSMRNPKDYCIINIGKTIFSISEIVDFLRSKGYALPWMELSVEEMIEFGWIKLN